MTTYPYDRDVFEFDLFDTDPDYRVVQRRWRGRYDRPRRVGMTDRRRCLISA